MADLRRRLSGVLARTPSVAFALAAVAILWWVGVRVIGPWLIAAMYGSSLPVVVGVSAAVEPRSVEYYVDRWLDIGWYALPVLLWSVLATYVRDQRQLLLILPLLIVSLTARAPGLMSRSIWDDEGITLLQTSGHNLPEWPEQPGPASTAQALFQGVAGCPAVAEMLRTTDVHPPLYFCALTYWRAWLGSSLEVARALSLVCSLISVVFVYLLLRAAAVEAPLVPATTYALSSSAVFWGTEARPYAMAELFVLGGALFAYLAWASVSKRRSLVTGYAAASGLFCGLATQANYLTSFPAGLTVLWLVATLWRRHRSAAVLGASIAASVLLLTTATVLSQLGARPDQAAGFQGFIVEVQYFFSLLCRVLFYPYLPRSGFIWPYAVAGGLLTAVSVGYLAWHWKHVNRRAWMLLLTLAFAPPAGVFLLNVWFDKHIHDLQYAHYAAAGMAALVAYPVARIATRNPPAALVALLVIVGIEAAGINWGFHDGPIASSHSRRLAREISASPSSSQLVLIDAGLGRSNPVSLVYELDPETTMLVFGSDHDAETLLNTVLHYEEVWVRFSTDFPASAIRDPFIDRLEASGCYMEVSYSSMIFHLRRRPACEPGQRWPSRRRLQQDLKRLEL